MLNVFILKERLLLQQMNQNTNDPLPQEMQQNQASLNHGGHELFDAHEVITGLITMLDQYQMYDQYIRDPELKSISSRQQDFANQIYYTIVQSFQTGQQPSVPTQTYQITQSINTFYGIKSGLPKKPNQSINDISDQGLSSYMLGQTKSLSTLLAMTALEMTNPILRRVIADSVPDFIEMSFEIFLYQNKNGYYQVPQLTVQDMQKMLNSYALAPQKGTTH